MLHPMAAVAQAFINHVNQVGPDGLVGCRHTACRMYADPEAADERGRCICPCGVMLKNGRTFRKHLREIHGTRTRKRARYRRRAGEFKARR